MTIVMSAPQIKLVVIGSWNMSAPDAVRPTCITMFDAANVVGDVFSKKKNCVRIRTPPNAEVPTSRTQLEACSIRRDISPFAIDQGRIRIAEKSSIQNVNPITGAVWHRIVVTVPSRTNKSNAYSGAFFVYHIDDTFWRRRNWNFKPSLG